MRIRPGSPSLRGGLPSRNRNRVVWRYGQNQRERGNKMLWTIAVILLILWLLGLISGYAMGGFIHVLLVIAIVVVVLRVIQGRRPL